MLKVGPRKPVLQHMTQCKNARRRVDYRLDYGFVNFLGIFARVTWDIREFVVGNEV